MRNYNVCLNDLIDNTNLILHIVYINYFEDDDIMVGDDRCIVVSTKNVENIECNENIYSKQCEIQIIIDNVCTVRYDDLAYKKIIKGDNYSFIFFKDYDCKDNKFYVHGDELAILLLLTDLL